MCVYLQPHLKKKIEPFLIGKNKFNNDNSYFWVSLIKTKGIEIA